MKYYNNTSDSLQGSLLLIVPRSMYVSFTSCKWPVIIRTSLLLPTFKPKVKEVLTTLTVKFYLTYPKFFTGTSMWRLSEKTEAVKKVLGFLMNKTVWRTFRTGSGTKSEERNFFLFRPDSRFLRHFSPFPSRDRTPRTTRIREERWGEGCRAT